MFNDRASMTIAGGRGGDGALSFRREKFVPKGGPDGGDGGRGGDVVFVADAQLRDLSRYRTIRHVQGGRGGNGGGARKHGADGEPKLLPVPVGTQVLAAGEELVADLAHGGAQAVVARGGDGGRGNARFATPRRQTPRFAETGLPGEELEVELRLKLLADAALVGLPNAGKSSLLRRISNAKPRVADYPFTTLAPVLGTVDARDGSRQLTVADVPGLIEGASRGVGLGHEFLAHLERSRLLVHVIDAAAGGTEEQFGTIDAELHEYGAGLELLPQIVVLNKIDVLRSPTFQVDDRRIVGVFRLSAATGEGVEDFRRELFRLVPPVAGAPDQEPELADFLVYRPAPQRRPRYRVLRTDRGFRVVGEAPEGAELERALAAAGARKGALVEIGDEEREV